MSAGRATGCSCGWTASTTDEELRHRSIIREGEIERMAQRNDGAVAPGNRACADGERT